MSPDQATGAILITSAGPEEGKTTVAANLAITMAQSGARVVVVDTDMRKPRLHKVFRVAPTIGISSLILGEARVEDAVIASAVPGLDILGCGAIPPNPAELFHTETFRALLRGMRERYDRVILDSPPVGAVSDALVLSSMVDGVTLVVNASKTTIPQAQRARQRIQDVGGRIYGAVLNGVDLSNSSTRGYYQYYYYRSGYTDTEPQAAARLTA
jgi:capsular exopolysaccharide synthesis family protein